MTTADLTTIYNLLKKADSVELQIKILEKDAENLRTVAQYKCPHPGTVTKDFKTFCIVCSKTLKHDNTSDTSDTSQ